MDKLSQEPDDYRAILYQRQSVINREFVSDRALNACNRWLIQGVSDVLLKKRGEKVGYGHLQTCKKRWVCPVCADRAARQTRARLLRALGAEQACGFKPLFITYTAQHYAGESLAVSIRRVAGAHRALHSGKRFHDAAMSDGYDGSFRSLEITYGEAGWHFHIHELAFIMRPKEVSKLADVLVARWPSALAKLGGYASPKYGLDLKDADAEIHDYMTKFGIADELTRAAQKQKREGGLLPFQLADVPISEPKRTEWARRLFVEYSDATRGLQQSCPGGSLRALFRHIKDNPTETEFQVDILASLTVDEWRSVVKRGKRAELLRAVENGDKVLFDTLIA